MKKALIISNTNADIIAEVLTASGFFSVDTILDNDSNLTLNLIKQYDLFVSVNQSNNKTLCNEALQAGIPGVMGPARSGESVAYVCQLMLTTENAAGNYSPIYSIDESGIAPMPGPFTPFVNTKYIGYFRRVNMLPDVNVLCTLYNNDNTYGTVMLFDKNIPLVNGSTLPARAAVVGPLYNSAYTADGALLLVNCALWAASAQATVEGKVKAHDGTPLSRRVRFHYKTTGLRVFDVMSDANNEGKFSGYAPPGQYYGIAFDEESESKNAVVYDNITIL